MKLSVKRYPAELTAIETLPLMILKTALPVCGSMMTSFKEGGAELKVRKNWSPQIKGFCATLRKGICKTNSKKRIRAYARQRAIIGVISNHF
jgi:hypothetical protein